MTNSIWSSAEDKVEYYYDTYAKIELANRIVVLEKRLIRLQEKLDKIGQSK